MSHMYIPFIYHTYAHVHMYFALAPSRAHYAQGTNARAHAHYSNGARNFLVASK